MNNFSPEYYFDFEGFAHKKLFENCQYVWEVLGNLKPYLRDHKLGVIEGEVSDKAYLINPELISIGPGSVVEPGAYIKGPCVIGKQCEVRQGAYIRGFIVTGDLCVLGHDTEIKHSILLNRVAAAHFAYVGDTILGNQVNLGAGVKCANMRLDHQNIAINSSIGKWDSQMRKLGLIAGDRAQIGCNAVSNPGTLLGPESICYPCVNFGGVIAARSIVKSQMMCEVVQRS